MPTWADIPGQDRVIARLRAAIAQDRVHHAYLLTGPTGSGKRRTALALASALNCLEHPGEGCTTCEACEKIEGGFHPDVVTLEREGAANMVPIETIRREVVARIAMPPHEARVRVFVIDEATALAPPAANSLLKTLEEPPARTMFVLGTIAPDQLLPTIRSRSQRLVFAPVAGTDILAGEEPERAGRLAQLADAVAGFGGGPVWALAQKIADGKGDAPLVLGAAAARLHRRARDEVAAGAIDAARTSAEKGRRLLVWQQSLILHNANPLLAMEAVLGELAGAV